MATTLESVLAAMEMRGRHTYRDLAAQIDTSEQLVQYHVEKSISDGIIYGLNAVIDVTKINYAFYLLYLRFFGLSGSEERKWLEHTDRDSVVAFVARSVGKWNATFGIVSQSHVEVARHMQELTKTIQGKIAEMVVSTEIECTYCSLQILQKNKTITWNTGTHSDPVAIDSVDFQILLLLSKNCRTTASEIARICSVSPSTVARRIERLEETKVILGYRAHINFEHFGYAHYRILLKLTNITEKDRANICNELIASGRVESVSRYIGLADLDFRCYARSLEELATFLDFLRDQFSQKIVEVEIVPLFVWKRINYFSPTQ